MKNLFFSLLVVGVAFAGSAFTSQKALNDYYVQNSDGTYRLVSASNFNPALCESSEETCAFKQITNDNLPASLTAQEVQDLVTPPTGPSKLSPVVDPITSDPIKGIYID